jgi:hypothetical protein
LSGWSGGTAVGVTITSAPNAFSSRTFSLHLVGHREDAFIAAQRGGDRQTNAGIAAGAFDDGARF